MLQRALFVFFQKTNLIISFLIRFPFLSRNRIDLVKTNSITRLPKELTKKSSTGLKKNSRFPAGVTFCISTNSEKFTVEVFYKKRAILSNMSPIATSAIDIYEFTTTGLKWITSVAPKKANAMYIKTVLETCKGKRYLLIMPSFAQIEHIFIKDKEASLDNVTSNVKTKILAYGSSITQGCAASRPGLNYVNVLSTYFGYEVLNFGFSESAKGEAEIIHYISKIGAEVYLLEYDHNASLDELKKTHSNVYKIIRKDNPDSIIIFLSRISGGISITKDEDEKRISIIRDTYQRAVNSGDNRVYYICGRDLVEGCQKEYLKDDRHPNDKGMFLIAEAVNNVLTEAGSI